MTALQIIYVTSPLNVKLEGEMPANIALEVCPSSKRELLPVDQLKSSDEEFRNATPQRLVSNMNSLSLHDSRSPRVKRKRVVFRKGFGRRILHNRVRKNSKNVERPDCEVNIITDSKILKARLLETSLALKKQVRVNVAGDRTMEVECKEVENTCRAASSSDVLPKETQGNRITETAKETMMRLLMKDPEELRLEFTEFFGTEISKVTINRAQSDPENLTNEESSKSPNSDALSSSPDLPNTKPEMPDESLESTTKVSELEVSDNGPIDQEKESPKLRLGKVIKGMLKTAMELITSIHGLIDDGRYFLKKCTVPDARGMTSPLVNVLKEQSLQAHF